MTMNEAFGILRRNRSNLTWKTREKALRIMWALGIPVHEVQQEIGRELDRHEKSVVLGMLSHQF
jgi:hypothetical protein